MSLGMPREEYWYGPVQNAFDYIEADRFKQERFNQEAWLQGMYVCEAFASVLSNILSKHEADRLSYPDKPYSLKPKEKENTEDKEAARASLYMQQMIQAGANWGKQE